MAQKFLIRSNDDEGTWELRRDEDVTYVRRDGEEEWRPVELSRVGDSGLYVLMLDNHPIELYIERRRGGAVVTVGRHQFDYDVGPWRPGARRARGGQGPAGVSRVTAPMTGSIVEVRCSSGDTVESGQVLLVMESMKMNNELRSPADGTVE